MTGGEIAASGAMKAAASAAAKAVGEDKDVEKALLEAAKDSPAMGAAADAMMKRIAVKQEIRLSLWRPVARLFGASREYFNSSFAEELAAKTSAIPDENLIKPKGSVAGPAVMGLGFSLEEPNLKEMYLNLLATAADSRKPGAAHPSFAEIIRQLSSEEAETLLSVLLGPSVPICEIRRQDNDNGSYGILRTHVLDIRDTGNGTPSRNDDFQLYVDNWIRLRLVTVLYGSTIVGEGMYDWVEERPEFIAAKAEYANQPTVTVIAKRGLMAATDFGRSFAKAVSPMPLVPPPADAPDD